MCEDSPRIDYNDTTASSLSTSHEGQELAWRQNFKLTPPPPSSSPTHPSGMCNPQDHSQMHNEMSWGPTDDLTEEEL
eukprot:10915697-Karenia_brevis.AAC.1